MHESLTEGKRLSFFLSVLRILQAIEAKAIVVVEDTSRGRANFGLTPEQDVTRLFLERVNNELRFEHTGIVIADRPSGGRMDEEMFLGDCLELLHTGTNYVPHPEQLALVLTTNSHLSRLLQAADLVVSCSVARVAGEARHSPKVFEAIRPLFCKAGRIGGIGVKIHPDYVYANLYHWLLGDTELTRGGRTTKLPMSSRPYREGPDRP